MRNEFTATDRLNMLRRSGGFCECHLLARSGIPGFSADGCGARLGPGNTFFEHVIPDNMGGKATPENGAALTRTCWRLKTDTYDAPKIAETRDMTKSVFGIKERRGPPMPGSRASKFKRTMRGRTVLR